MDNLRELLNAKRDRGEFDGQPEEHLDFFDLSDEDVEYYLEWLDEDELEEYES